MKNLYKYIKFLGLKKPVNIKLILNNNKHADAEYLPEYSDSGRLLEHFITVFYKNTYRDLDTLIAHELIHAWQEEHKKEEIHGKYFVKYAKKMTEEFNLEKIYIPEIDVN